MCTGCFPAKCAGCEHRCNLVVSNPRTSSKWNNDRQDINSSFGTNQTSNSIIYMLKPTGVLDLFPVCAIHHQGVPGDPTSQNQSFETSIGH